MQIRITSSSIEVTKQSSRVDTEKARDFIKTWTRNLAQRLASGGPNAIYTTGCR